MTIFLDILATVMVLLAVICAADPKYRYNEHCKWEPSFAELAVMAVVIGFIGWRIWG